MTSGSLNRTRCCYLAGKSLECIHKTKRVILKNDHSFPLILIKFIKIYFLIKRWFFACFVSMFNFVVFTCVVLLDFVVNFNKNVECVCFSAVPDSGVQLRFAFLLFPWFSFFFSLSFFRIYFDFLCVRLTENSQNVRITVQFSSFNVFVVVKLSQVGH